MKRLVFATVFTLIATTAFAIVPEGFAPNGNKQVTLTVNSQTVNMTMDAAWNVYATSACKYRTMPTATKAGSTNTIPATTPTGRYVNKLTPFINFSGCVNGELQRQ